MKNCFLFSLCCLAVLKVYSQNIKGTVYNENKLPVAGAVVYMDGTSFGTITDENGHFEIPSTENIYTALIVNYMGYKSVAITNPFAKKFHIIQLTPMETQLGEVTVYRKKSTFKRIDKLLVFREQFLGTTTAGKSCKIMNESDLELYYINKKNRLVITSAVPVIIHNEFLGYDIEYRIKECYIDFSRKTVNNKAVSGWSFIGTTFFKDLTTISTSYFAKRMMSYNASQMQFFRNLSRKSLDQTQFQILRGSRRCNPDHYFSIEDQGNQYLITVLNKNLRPNEPFYQSFTLEYPGKSDSQVFFYTKKFSVDKLGNNSAYNDILFSGDISTKRVGDLLPLDFKIK